MLWVPGPGDRFIVPNREMDDDVFVVSDMTVEVHDYPGGKVIGFNGTTEWALDSIEQREVVWLPRENQLRELLADRFVRLEAVPDGCAVDLAARDNGRAGEHRFTGPDAEQAYAEALIALLTP